MALLSVQGREQRAESEESEEWCAHMATDSYRSTAGGRGCLQALKPSRVLDELDEYMFAGMASFDGSASGNLCLASSARPSETDDVCVECVGGGSHPFREQIVARPIECSGCSRLLEAGAVLFACTRCTMDICEECYAQVRSQEAAPKVEGEARHAQASSEDVTPDFHDRDESFSEIESSSSCTASLSAFPYQDSFSTVATECDVQETGPEQDASSMFPLADKKMCSHCFVSYRGFGDVCGACRKGGQRGGIKKCQCCGDYFQGFSASCLDCRVTTGLCA